MEHNPKGWKPQFEPWPEFVFMIISHWFEQRGNGRFKMCLGCREDLHARRTWKKRIKQRSQDNAT